MGPRRREVVQLSLHHIRATLPCVSRLQYYKRQRAHALPPVEAEHSEYAPSAARTAPGIGIEHSMALHNYQHATETTADWNGYRDILS